MTLSPSPNFAFLSVHDPIFVEHGAKAERYVFDDPIGALVRLRQFGEALAQQTAAKFWRDVLSRWSPVHIIAAGAVAKDVLRRAGWSTESKEKTTLLVLPSRGWDGAASMFDVDDLLRRYPEAAEMMESAEVDGLFRPEDEHHRRRLVFYLCHAVSRSRTRGRPC